MRFRRWHRPEPYKDTSRKRAAFHRKQRLEREALPLFADQIADLPPPSRRGRWRAGGRISRQASA